MIPFTANRYALTVLLIIRLPATIAEQLYGIMMPSLMNLRYFVPSVMTLIIHAVMSAMTLFIMIILTNIVANIIAMNAMTKFAAAIRLMITATSQRLFSMAVIRDILGLNLKSTLAARKVITLMKYLKSAIILLNTSTSSRTVLLKTVWKS